MVRRARGPPVSSAAGILATRNPLARAHQALEMARAAYQIGTVTAEHYRAVKAAYTRAYKAAVPGAGKVKALSESTRTAIRRGDLNKHRHDEAQNSVGTKNSRLGKGFNRKAVGVTVTHPRGKVPRWKLQRLRDYKNDVFQTIFISQTSRQANSSNALKTVRSPIRLPECLNLNTTQTVMLSPFCAQYSGTHTTGFLHLNSTATDFVNSQEAAPTSKHARFDVIQNRVPLERHERAAGVEGIYSNPPAYQNAENTIGTVQNAANLYKIDAWYDQLFKKLDLDLVFSSCRAFPVEVSVSVIRSIKMLTPYGLSTEMKQAFANTVDKTKSLDYNDFVVEYQTKFTLGALRKGKDPPHKNVKHSVIANVLQTNAVNEDTIPDVLNASGDTLLGQGVSHPHIETVDGGVSSQMFLLISYRKKRTGGQQFTYTTTLESSRDTEATGWGHGVASVEMEALGDETGLDIPVHTGVHDSDGTLQNAGSPFGSSSGVATSDESKACCMLHGKIGYTWGFKDKTDTFPSVQSSLSTNIDYKKPVSLNIDPLATRGGTYSLYTKSQDDQKIPANTAASTAAPWGGP